MAGSDKSLATPRVVAIMVNWNGSEVAVAAARSVAEQSIRPHLLIVDNASQDGSTDRIEAAFSETTVIRNAANLGYAAANNQGLRAAPDADYYLLVNNDILLTEPDGLERVVRRMQADPEIRGACGRYEYPDGRYQHFYNRLPTPFDLAVNWGIARHIPGLLSGDGMRRFHAIDLDPSLPSTISQPAFACVLLRGDCARTVGFMDERFPIFFNDVDYCQRWSDRGWTWHFFPDWRIVHHHGTSIKKRLDFIKAEMFSSAARYAWKHFTPLTALAVHAALLGEAAWRRYRHRELTIPLGAIARCENFYCSNEPIVNTLKVS